MKKQKPLIWRSIASAPRDGTEILIQSYGDFEKVSWDARREAFITWDGIIYIASEIDSWAELPEKSAVLPVALFLVALVILVAILSRCDSNGMDRKPGALDGVFLEKSE